MLKRTTDKSVVQLRDPEGYRNWREHAEHSGIATMRRKWILNV